MLAVPGAPPNKALQLTWHSVFQSTFVWSLASTLGASATVGGLCHAAERPVRWAAGAESRGVSRALAIGVLLLAGIARSEPSLTIPPDRSLTVAAYVAQGMPDPTKEWGSSEARKAWTLLHVLYRDDPAILPRYRSGRSGPLFDKLLAESLTLEATVGDMTVKELETTIDKDFNSLSDRSLMSVYRVRPESGLLFDRELVEILGHALDQTATMWVESRESAAEIQRLITSYEATGRDSEATRARDLQESQAQIEVAFETIVLHSLRELALVPAVQAISADAEESAIWYLRNAYDRCQPLFSEEGAARAKEILGAAKALAGARDERPAAQQGAAAAEPQRVPTDQ